MQDDVNMKGSVLVFLDGMGAFKTHQQCTSLTYSEFADSYANRNILLTLVHVNARNARNEPFISLDLK